MMHRNLLAIGYLTLGLLAAAPHPVGAATFTVDETIDKPDKKPGDGRCNVEGLFTKCTLRAAIMEANKLPGFDTIVLPTGTYSLTIAPGANDQASGDLDVLSDMMIRTNGGRATIQLAGGIADRVVTVAGDGHVQMQDLTIRGGKLANTENGRGGGIAVDGASQLVLRRVDVIDNAAKQGGGISVDDIGGRVVIDSGSHVSGNSAVFSGSALVSSGEVIVNRGVEFRNNTGGAALFLNQECRLTMTGAILARNVGGAMFNHGTASILDATFDSNSNGSTIINQGTMTLQNSTVSRGRSPRDGGGIHNTGTLTLLNATITGNLAEQSGGGINNVRTLTINGATIAGNQAGLLGGGIAHNTTGAAPTLILRNTIIGDNVAPTGPDCRTVFADLPITSEGHNLIENPAGCVVVGDLTGNQTGVDARLTPLANNGGPTATMNLSVGSPAIDRGAPLGSPRPCLALDQRGILRPVDNDGDRVARCDIGAIEGSDVAVGFGFVSPADAIAYAGDADVTALQWTVPDSVDGWRSLRSLQLRFRDGDATALHVRFDEASGTLSLFDDKSGRFQRAVVAGVGAKLATRFASIDAAGAVVDGPPGQVVSLTLPIKWKRRAAGHTFTVEVAAEDDAGNVQAFEAKGTLEVERALRGRARVK
jgi:hypothetical protein